MINIYFGTVTGAGTDGTAASSDTKLSPIPVGPLDVAANEESDPVKLAIRCADGYVAAGVTVLPVGTGAAYWALAPDDAGSAGEFGSWGGAITIGAVTHANLIFWAKAKCGSAEAITPDSSVQLRVSATDITVEPS